MPGYFARSGIRNRQWAVVVGDVDTVDEMANDLGCSDFFCGSWVQDVSRYGRLVDRVNDATNGLKRLLHFIDIGIQEG